MPPTALDFAVADLAEAALAGSALEMQHALAKVKTLHGKSAMRRARAEGRPAMEGLVPLCLDLVNSTLDDPRAYREASEEILDSWSLDPDPALEARLEQAVADDPLALAGKRTRDHWESLFASTFNAVVEPLGKSLVWGVAIAPFNLATSLTHYAASLYARPSMSVQERQALAHRKRYVAQFPDSRDTPKLEKKIAGGQADLDDMRVERLGDEAADALARGGYALAEFQAQRALAIDPEDKKAGEILAEAHKERDRVEELRARGNRVAQTLPTDLALASSRGPASPDWQPSRLPRALLEALLVSTRVGDTFAPRDPQRIAREMQQLERLATEARMLRDSDPEGPLADEAEYVLALAQDDLGFDAQGWERLRRLANEDPRRSNMARHARALLSNPWQNTYGNFARQKHRASERANAFRLLGSFSEGARYPGLPAPIAYLLQAPAIAKTLVTAPVRLLFGPWDSGRDFERPAAIAGYRYLGREPSGQRSREVANWLFDYEAQREHWGAALRIVDLQPDADPFERMLLVERAARQQLDGADLADRRDWRNAILRSVAEQYPDTDAGHEAGTRLRAELERAAPQRIRITKSFLEENPQVAGARGLGMNPGLLDDELANGELHPLGVTFLGGRVMEFALVAESGEKDDAPVRRRERISQDRLSQTIAMLDETVLLNDQIDDGDAVTPDAFRDHYLERARLGLVEEPDMRASAESDYVYKSLREQYGVVRGRDSILPFSLVFQGSLMDLSLGAFPRWRQPRQTPDAFLYK